MVMKKDIGRIRRGLYGLLSWILIFPVAGCGLFDHEPDDVIIEIGSIRLTRDALKRELAFISRGMAVPGNHAEEVKGRLVRQVIDYYLIIEYGRENGIAVTEAEFQAELKALKKDYTEADFREALLRAYVAPESWEVVRAASIGIDSPSYEEIKAYFQENRAEFSSPEMVKFRQIVCKSKNEAQRLRARLKAGEDMGELAKKYSTAPEAENHGEVGWVARGDLDGSMEKTLFSLQAGRVSPVVKTAFGYHLFEVTDRRPAGLKGLAEVIDDIESRLLQQRQERFFEKWLRKLRAESKVKINQEMLNKIKLSQSGGTRSLSFASLNVIRHENAL
jgi:peptidyl-prolyl cis-trans isomerase C